MYHQIIFSSLLAWAALCRGDDVATTITSTITSTTTITVANTAHIYVTITNPRIIESSTTTSDKLSVPSAFLSTLSNVESPATSIITIPSTQATTSTSLVSVPIMTSLKQNSTTPSTTALLIADKAKVGQTPQSPVVAHAKLANNHLPLNKTVSDPSHPIHHTVSGISRHSNLYSNSTILSTTRHTTQVETNAVPTRALAFAPLDTFLPAVHVNQVSSQTRSIPYASTTNEPTLLSFTSASTKIVLRRSFIATAFALVALSLMF